jgi:autotransporter adhesin
VKKLKGMLVVGVVTISAVPEMVLAQGSHRKEYLHEVASPLVICNQSGFKNHCEVDIGSVDGDLVLDGVIVDLEALKGADGVDGVDGRSFTYEDFTEEQLEALRGADGESIKGDKGDTGERGAAFVFGDFTQEQLDSLKGEKGDSIVGATGAAGVDADMSVVDGNTETIADNTKAITTNTTAITKESLERQAEIEELNQDLNSFNAELNSVNAHHTSWNEAQDLQIRKINRELYGIKQDIVDLNDGVAMALAGNNLIQATNGGNVLSMAFGTYGSQSAVALGASANFGNENRWTTKMNFSVTERNAGFGAGVGYEF